jgi:hypothetical protein
VQIGFAASRETSSASKRLRCDVATELSAAEMDSLHGGVGGGLGGA